MSAKALDILLISQPSDRSVVIDALNASCPDAVVKREESPGLVLQLLNTTHPELIIIDWNVSTIHADELATRILKSLGDSPCYVIALTHTQIHYTQALQAGVHYIIDVHDERHAYTQCMMTFALLRTLEITRGENRLLRSAIRTKEQNEKQMVHAIEKTIQVRFPEAADSLPFISNAVEWIVDQFRNEEEFELEKTQINYAVHLAWLGRMHLPDAERQTRITLDGSATSTLTAFVPLQADAILEGVDSLEGARHILKNMYENYDGTGFPDRKQHWQIPLGSRILRAVCDLDELSRRTNTTAVEALETLKRFSRRVYDHRVVALLEEYVVNVSRRTKDKAESRAVQLFDLSEGMQLASDIVTNSGLKLMNAGTVLRDQLILRIQSHNAMDPILGNIYVREHQS